MGYTRQAYSRRTENHQHHVPRDSDREGRHGPRPRIPMNYLQEVLGEDYDSIKGVTVQEFINKKYDNVDRELPVHTTYNAKFQKLARADYARMNQMDEIDVMPKVRKLMFMRSIPGHANSGHGMFRHQARFVNANAEWVYRALHKEPSRARQRAQEIIDPIFEHVDLLLKDPSDPRVKRALDSKGNPLSGSYEVARSSIEDPIARLIGIYLGSRMDNYDWRARVRDRFKLEMGGGRCYALNLDKMIKEKITLETLSTNEHGPGDIERLVNKGIVIDKPTVKTEPGIINGYVRIKTGYGVSDDAAVITAGLLYGIEAAIGLLLVDSVDTWDKSTPTIYRAGQDEMLGDLILQRCEDRGIELPSDRQVEEFIYLSSINPMRVTLFPDCSQRRFNMRSQAEGEGYGWTAAKLHLEFVRRIRGEKFGHYRRAIERDLREAERLRPSLEAELEECRDMAAREKIADHHAAWTSHLSAGQNGYESMLKSNGAMNGDARLETVLDMSNISLNKRIKKGLPVLPISFRGVQSDAFQNTYAARWNKTFNDGRID